MLKAKSKSISQQKSPQRLFDKGNIVKINITETRGLGVIADCFYSIPRRTNIYLVYVWGFPSQKSGGYYIDERRLTYICKSIDDLVLKDLEGAMPFIDLPSIIAVKITEELKKTIQPALLKCYRTAFGLSNADSTVQSKIAVERLETGKVYKLCPSQIRFKEDSTCCLLELKAVILKNTDADITGDELVLWSKNDNSEIQHMHGEEYFRVEVAFDNIYIDKDTKGFKIDLDTVKPRLVPSLPVKGDVIRAKTTSKDCIIRKGRDYKVVSVPVKRGGSSSPKKNLVEVEVTIRGIKRNMSFDLSYFSYKQEPMISYENKKIKLIDFLKEAKGDIRANAVRRLKVSENSLSFLTAVNKRIYDVLEQETFQPIELYDICQEFSLNNICTSSYEDANAADTLLRLGNAKNILANGGYDTDLATGDYVGKPVETDYEQILIGKHGSLLVKNVVKEGYQVLYIQLIQLNDSAVQNVSTWSLKYSLGLIDIVYQSVTNLLFGDESRVESIAFRLNVILQYFFKPAELWSFFKVLDSPSVNTLESCAILPLIFSFEDDEAVEGVLGGLTAMGTTLSNYTISVDTAFTNPIVIDSTVAGDPGF